MRVARSPWLPYLYLLWFVVVCDPHRLIGWYGPAFFHRTATILFIPVVLDTMMRGPTLGRRHLVPAYFAYVAFAFVGGVFAFIRPIAMETLQSLALYYVLGVATLIHVRAPAQAIPLVLIMFLQYLWWGAFAGVKDGVWWHPALDNADGWGGLMAQGIGLCFWVGVAARKPWMRYAGFALAAYCLLGVVSSFARGAILSTFLVAGYIWFRAPRKGVATLGLIGGAAVFVAASTLLFPGGALWNEIMSSFHEGASEGTGLDRWELWQTAWRVFLDRPLLGAGASNFGPYAASVVSSGELANYTNPGWLWDRNLHSVYFQILSEFGFAGVVTFAWLILTFFKAVRSLRQPARRQVWDAQVGRRLDLRYFSYGLEASMVGILAGGFFYASLYQPGVYTTLAMGFALVTVTQPRPGQAANPAAPVSEAGRGRRRRTRR